MKKLKNIEYTSEIGIESYNLDEGTIKLSIFLKYKPLLNSTISIFDINDRLLYIYDMSGKIFYKIFDKWNVDNNNSFIKNNIILLEFKQKIIKLDKINIEYKHNYERVDCLKVKIRKLKRLLRK